MNKLYKHFYSLYYPLYDLWKTVSDKYERDLLEKLIKPGMNIVDVGANVGVYTKFLSMLTGKTGKVYAFEPDPLNFIRLQNHVRYINNVLIKNAAIGAQSGSANLYISDDLNVDHRTFDSGDGRKKITVPLLSLDDYFPPGKRIDLIKIDVQGYEMSVLMGAKRLLRENTDIKILMEFWPYGLIKASVNPSEMIEFIHSFGFKIRIPTRKGWDLYDISKVNSNEISNYHNFILMRS